MYIKPILGMVIPDPERRDMLPAEGREVASFVEGDRNVPVSDHWKRRQNEGDIVESDPPKEAPPDDATSGTAGEHPIEPAHEGA